MLTPPNNGAPEGRHAIRAQRRRAFTALAHRQHVQELRGLVDTFAGTEVGRDAYHRAWRLLYRAEAWEALAEGDAALARSYHRAAIRPAARAFA
ncbi:MAG TPA: hypothetical protein VNS22_07175 [Geminicoccus sp.]|uniref:hypothetical protein n=1 Tax=Geminicoccus sp. TaxID=2024832 RepID=UPI002CADC555|nr:hypothetical protein [Geminicoccus sp.]HWL68153.1 hypothetical protein [Geminicoccus sp.]